MIVFGLSLPSADQPTSLQTLAPHMSAVLVFCLSVCLVFPAEEVILSWFVSRAFLIFEFETKLSVFLDINPFHSYVHHKKICCVSMQVLHGTRS